MKVTDIQDKIAAGEMSAAAVFTQMRQHVDALTKWIETEGEINNTCTKNVTGNICSSCACGKKLTKGE